MTRQRAIPYLRSMLCAALLLPAARTPFAAPEAVTLVVSEESAAYLEAAREIRGALLAGGSPVPMTLLRADAFDRTARRGAGDLVIALGVAAMEAVAGEREAAVFNALVPRRAFERGLRVSGRVADRRYSALYLDQPAARQLNLVRVALPGRASVGLLLSDEAGAELPALQAAAGEARLRLVVERLGEEARFYESLRRLVVASDVLLAQPDPRVFNGETLQNILLTTYRWQRPMIAFSPAYVRAGALAAVYSTPAQIGAQVGAMANAYSATVGLPAPGFPQNFEVGINERVARSLNITLEAAGAMALRLRQMEGRR